MTQGYLSPFVDTANGAFQSQAVPGSYRVVSKTSVSEISGLVKQLKALWGSGEGLVDWNFPVPPGSQSH